jgi:hypothetical protein
MNKMNKTQTSHEIMKTKIPHLILAGLLGASTLSTQAATVYTSGFDTTYTSNNNAVLLGGATPNVTTEN